MYRLLFDHYPIALVMTLVVVVGMTVNLWLIKKHQYSIRSVLLFLLSMGIVQVIGAKVFNLLLRGKVSDFHTELLGGYRYPGALIATLIVLPAVRHILPKDLSLARLGDLLAPGIAFSMATYRIHCFAVGCCYGPVTTLPWAIRFPKGSIPWRDHYTEHLISSTSTLSLPLHPLQLYFMVASLLVGFFLLWYLPRKSFDGQVILLYLVLHEGAKFLLEYLRVNYHLTIQLTSLALCLLGIIGLVFMKTRQAGKVPVRDVGML